MFALGLGEKIVGVTTFCDYPEEAKKKPKIGGMSNPSIEAVLRLKPDIVVMTTGGNPKAFAERLKSVGIKIYVFTAKRLSELPKGVRELGAALGVTEKADRFATDYESALAGFRRKHLKTGMDKRKVLFVVWPNPLIVAGPDSVMDDAITLVGGKNIAAGARAEYPKFSIEEIIKRSPDTIFIGSGKGMEEGVQGLLGRLRNVPAVMQKRIFYVGDDLYRLGPRTIRGIQDISRAMEE